VHIQLQTRSKLFCRCPAGFGAPANTQTCPVCLGHPGTLPVVNRRAVALAARLGFAVGGRVHRRSLFARKHYFYPDLPKGYQITQFESPLCEGGAIPILVEGGEREIRIKRIHLEEDAGKMSHPEREGQRDSSVDFNRGGVPLAEIVSEPELRSPSEAAAYLAAVRQLVQYLEISGGRMEMGHLRCDANVSIRRRGSLEMNPRTELKNLNSIKNVEKGIEAEIIRQHLIRRGGGPVTHMTLLWDQVAGGVRSMRSKEERPDYRYFPEPDLPPLVLDDELLKHAQREAGELPWDIRRRFQEDWNLPAADAERLTRTRPDACDFQSLVVQLSAGDGRGSDAEQAVKTAANWVIGDLRRILRRVLREEGPCARRPAPQAMAAFLRLVMDRVISGDTARAVLEVMVQTGRPADQIVKEQGLALINDEATIRGWIAEVLNNNPDAVEEYLAGKAVLKSYFVGCVMRRSDGKACPRTVAMILTEDLAFRKAKGGE
ncbi:MAG: Asp-tRNA(Asn)/Glu-tRNA(Gln) amidotransferase subunit GatB, partial [Candidatus Eisenbacteria bacterium]|nr:Asp-tRNA(Asn)/Glu-tRNA(Gln) amidotransferase subunit GatB [Candidatus Eisenbacteria bacterium]